MWFAKTPVGEHFVAEIVKHYIQVLLVQSPHFAGCEELKFTNTSIRKSHNDTLVDADAPLIIQQESLAQNTKAYAKGPSHPINKLKVAEVISGKRTSWNQKLKQTSSSNEMGRLPFKKCAVIPPNIPSPRLPFNDENSNPNSTFNFSFSKGDAKFDFQFRL